MKATTSHPRKQDGRAPKGFKIACPRCGDHGLNVYACLDDRRRLRCFACDTCIRVREIEQLGAEWTKALEWLRREA